VGIGDMLLKAVLRALRRFLLETPSAPKRDKRQQAIVAPAEHSVIKIPVKSGRTSPNKK
jgi:hypothetical protein